MYGPYGCPHCSETFQIPEAGRKTMIEKGRGHDPNLNPIIIVCPNNCGYALIIGGDYDDFEEPHYDMWSYQVGISYMPSSPPATREIRGVFIGVPNLMTSPFSLGEE